MREHGPEQGKGLKGLAGERVGQPGQDLFGDVIRCPGQLLHGTVMRHALEQFLLGTEIVHDQAAVDAGRAGDLPDGGPLVAAVDEQA